MILIDLFEASGRKNKPKSLIDDQKEVIQRALDRYIFNLNSDNNRDKFATEAYFTPSLIRQDTAVSDLDYKKSEILEILTNKFSKTDNLENVLRNIYMLHFNKVQWPELRTILEEHKSSIIKYLLRLIGGKYTLIFAGTEANRLKRMGITWPELDTIKKSVDYESNKLLDNITENSEQNSELFDQFKHIFTVNLDPWRACNFLEQNHLTVNNCSQLKPFLEEYKVSLIQAFLQAIQNGGDSAQIVKIMTRRLINTEIGWNELQILNRSATAIYDEHLAKLNESWTPSARQEQARALLTTLDELLTSDKTNFQRVDDILDSLVNTISGQVFDAAMNRRKGKILEYLNRSIANDIEIGQSWWAIVQTFIEYTPNTWPEIIDIINSHKHLIIKLILTKIQKLNFRAARRMIDLMGYVNINWPEFDIMQRSLEVDRKRTLELHEAALSNEASNRIKKLVDNMEKFESIKDTDVVPSNMIEYAISSLKFNNIRQGEITRALEEIKPQILRYLNYIAQRGPFFILISEISNLKKFKNWPELMTLIEEAKPKIIKVILIHIKNLKFDLAEEICLMLTRQLKLSWPELTTLEKSIRYELGKNGRLNEEFDLDQYHLKLAKFTIGNMVTTMDRCEHSNEISMSLIFDTIQKLTSIKMKPREIDQQFTQIKPEILKYLKYLAKREPLFTVKHFAAQIYVLQKVCDWPELTALLEATKPRLIKLMLVNINDLRFEAAKDVWFLLKHQMNLPWPELDIIGKSIDHELERQEKLNEAVDYDEEDTIEDEDSNADEDFKRVKHLLKVGRLVYAIEEMRTLRLTVDNCAGLAELLNKYKSTLIKLILNNTKLNLDVGRTIFYELKYTKMLIATGIGWPELEAIRKSLQDTYDRTANVN